MKHFLETLLLLLLMTFSLSAQTPSIPDTPAGHTLQAWLDAFNSGDRGRIQAYLEKYEPEKSVDSQVDFRNQTGGFELLGIDKSDRLQIEFRVKGKASPINVVGKIKVKDADPAEVVSFSLRTIPPGLTAADMNLKIDAETRARVIDGTVAKLNEFYVFPETAKKMAEAVQARLKSGAYDAVTGADDFATTLTDDLQAVSHDKHLRVNFSPQVLPKMDPGANPTPNPAVVAQRKAQIQRVNCTFKMVEHLP